jgi:acetyltransferase-like isoleucine patch superfamily enzyme
MLFSFLLAKLFKKIRLSAIKNSTIHRTSKVESGSLVYNTEMGKHSYCGYDCEIINTKIGNFTSIANNVVIGGSNHPMHWVGMSPVFYEGRDSIKKKFSEFKLDGPKETHIGNDVWIGRSSIVLGGVKINDGAVVGAGSVVTKEVPHYAIVAGSPAKIIKYRFDEDTIQQLIKINWWSFSDAELSRFAHTIKDVKLFIDTISKSKRL